MTDKATLPPTPPARTPPRDAEGRIIREGVFRFWHDDSATDEDIERATEEYLRRSRARKPTKESNGTHEPAGATPPSEFSRDSARKND